MPILDIQGLRKEFDGVVAVNNLDMAVEPGEIFGLLGPNGAGKTTTIRIVMDILKPDAGVVRVLGEPPGGARERVGYLPEERGLYRNLKVLDTLVYLAEIKGMAREMARQRGLALLERVELADWAHRKVRDLSRGMQQKLQIIASFVHDPELVVLDEPFQGLDPINVRLVRELIAELREQGKTVMLSTHQMNLVEALCQRIVLIHRGRAVLYGPLADIKRHYASNTVRVRTPAALDGLPGVARIEVGDGGYTLTLAEGVTPQVLLRTLMERDIEIEAFEIASVPLEQIFITVVKEDRHEQNLGRSPA